MGAPRSNTASCCSVFHNAQAKMIPPAPASAKFHPGLRPAAAKVRPCGGSLLSLLGYLPLLKSAPAEAAG